MSTGIRTPGLAGRAQTTGGVGQYRGQCSIWISFGTSRPQATIFSSDFVPWHSRIGRDGVKAPKGIQIAAAVAYPACLQHHVTNGPSCGCTTSPKPTLSGSSIWIAFIGCFPDGQRATSRCAPEPECAEPQGATLHRVLPGHGLHFPPLAVG